MTTGKMHPDEPDIDAALVERLVAEQFPGWKQLPVRPVRSSGTDNAMFRLGDELAVRLPRVSWAVNDVDKEGRWLPELAPRLPLPIPVPLDRGRPAHGYAWPWSVCRWVEGNPLTLDGLSDPDQAAKDLAGFILALQGIDTPGEPLPGTHEYSRGVPLARRDGATREAIAALSGVIDTHAVTAVWEDALRAPPWDAPPVWIHGDLQAGNLLSSNGQLGGVIDFGLLNVGDPAADLIVAWNFFPARTREIFRAALGTDDDTWIRGRGWALSVALIALPYYQHTNPAIAEASRRTIAAVLADAGPPR